MGSKHLLDNLTSHMTKSMVGFKAWKDEMLTPVAKLICNGFWRDRLIHQCLKDTPAEALVKSVSSSIAHVDIRWGELCNLVSDIYPLREPLTQFWDLKKMSFHKWKHDNPDEAAPQTRQLCLP